MNKFLILVATCVTLTLAFVSPGFAQSGPWQGIFDTATQHNGIWTAKVRIYGTNELRVQQFNVCKPAKHRSKTGWACTDEIINFDFGSSNVHQPANNNAGGQCLKSPIHTKQNECHVGNGEHRHGQNKHSHL